MNERKKGDVKVADIRDWRFLGRLLALDASWGMLRLRKRPHIPKAGLKDPQSPANRETISHPTLFQYSGDAWR